MDKQAKLDALAEEIVKEKVCSDLADQARGKASILAIFTQAIRNHPAKGHFDLRAAQWRRIYSRIADQ